MSITAGKTARNEENNEDQNTEVEATDLLEELLGNGDTEVFSTLIPLMKNVGVLKTRRLVCKSWNQFACRALRKHSRVYYSVNENYPDKTKSQRKLILGNVHLGLPSPFRIFKVHATTLTMEQLLRFLKYLRESTSGFLLDLSIISHHVDPAELQAILTCNQNNLKIIKLTLSGKIIDKDVDGGNIFQPEVIRLPHLRTLQIKNRTLHRDKVVSLCENICRYSPLQSLSIWSSSLKNNLQIVMSSMANKSLDQFYLKFSKALSLDDWKLLRASIFKMIGIKKLSIYHPDASTYTDVYHEKFETIIGHFADSLESLAGDYLPRLNNKHFPKLQEITNTPFDFEFYYPLESYPLLSKATFVAGCHDIFRDIPDEPNLAIQHLSFQSPTVTDPNSLLKIISLAGWRFPNVTNFSVKSEKIQFTSAMLRSIRESFPKISELELRVFLRDHKTLYLDCEKLSLSGCTKVGPWKGFPENHLFWTFQNGDVSAIDIRDSVGHLTRIKVIVWKSINPREKWVEEMEHLRTMLPAVVEIRKIAEE